MTKKCEILNRSNLNHDNVQHYRDLLLLFVFLIFSQSCNQPSQGCRNINATKYDVTADEDCEDDCCQLPQLKIQFSHKIEQRVGEVDSVINFKYNTSYLLSAEDTFSFQKIKCYFSNFRLIDMNGGEVQVNDRLTIDLEGDEPDSITIVDDVILFDAGATNYTLGEFDEPNTFEGLKFTVGLQSELFTTNPEIAPDGSAFQPDSINYEENLGYIPQKYVFFSRINDPERADSTVFRVFDPIEVELSSDPFALVTGFDATLLMTVRYDQLFENIIFGDSILNDFRQNIVSNLPNAITLEGLDQN